MLKVRKNELYLNQVRLAAEYLLDWEKLNNKTILISGATGMIGVFLIDVLMYRNKAFNSNIHIIAMGRDYGKLEKRLGIYLNKPEFNYFKHDVNIPTIQRNIEKKVNYIIHGASNTHPIQYSTDPIGTIEANVIGTKNLLEFSALHDSCRFVYLSSVEIYGENRGDTEFFDEEYCGYINCNTLRACYTESKRLGETLCQAYISSKSIDVVIPRLCRVYGPTMFSSDSKALSQFIQKAVSGEDIVLKSEGKQRFSFIHVADAVSAILTVMLNGKVGEAYNVSDNNEDYCLRDLGEFLAKLSGNKVIYELPDEEERKGYSTATKALLNNEKLRELGWECQYSIWDGLRETYEILS